MLSKNCNKLTASSLMETLVALNICAACLGIAILIFIRVAEKSQSIVLVKAEQQITQIRFKDWLEDTVPETGEETIRGFTISKTKEKVDLNAEAVRINYRILIQNKTLERTTIFDTEK